MYPTILVTIENSKYDSAILDHIEPLAKLCGSRLILLHVADGWAARNYDLLSLQESDEIKEDRDYLASLVAALETKGFEASSRLAMGDPAKEIIKFASENPIDLIAMATHGHRLVGDVIHGSTADKVRHEVRIPVLMLKAKR